MDRLRSGQVAVAAVVSSARSFFGGEPEAKDVTDLPPPPTMGAPPVATKPEPPRSSVVGDVAARGPSPGAPPAAPGGAAGSTTPPSAAPLTHWLPAGTRTSSPPAPPSTAAALSALRTFEPSIYISRATTLALVGLAQAVYRWPRLARWRVRLSEHFERVDAACWTRRALVRAFLHGMVPPDEAPGSILHYCKEGLARMIESAWDESRTVQLRFCWEHGQGISHDVYLQSHPFFD